MTTTLDSAVADVLRGVPTECFIGGAWREARDGARFDVVEPSSGEIIASVANGAVADGLDALDAAQGALGAWSATAPRTRSEVIRRAYELMVERADAIARLIVVENGKTFAEALGETLYAAEFFRWYAEEAVRNFGEVAIAPSGANRILVVHQPIGVALLITPWNFPAAMLTRKIGPALAAGCTVVCKPASETPITALFIAALLEEAGVPPGVVNVVPSRHSSAFATALLDDGRVRKLSFTGSTEVGSTLLELAAKRIVNCSMELGGNAPFLVFGDADIDAAIAGAMIAKMRNGGEACTSANRFFVEAWIANEFSTRLAETMGKLKMGFGLAEGTELGPLVNASSRDKVAELVEGALSAGAKVLTGARVPAGPGFFYPPTVLADVSPDAPILREEIFGPVAPIVTFDGESEAIELSNATEFGLVSYLYTRDLARGLRVAEALESGMVGLNRGLVSDPAAPFGGVKQSGIGREGGHEGMAEFMETKYVACNW